MKHFYLFTATSVVTVLIFNVVSAVFHVSMYCPRFHTKAGNSFRRPSLQQFIHEVISVKSILKTKVLEDQTQGHMSLSQLIIMGKANHKKKEGTEK